MNVTYLVPIHYVRQFFQLVFLWIFCLPIALAGVPKSIEAAPALLKRLEIEELEPREVHDTLRLSARVELDQHRVARIGATVTGRITEISAVLGQKVKKRPATGAFKQYRVRQSSIGLSKSPFAGQSATLKCAESEALAAKWCNCHCTISGATECIG